MVNLLYKVYFCPFLLNYRFRKLVNSSLRLSVHHDVIPTPYDVTLSCCLPQRQHLNDQFRCSWRYAYPSSWSEKSIFFIY